LYGISADM